MRSAPIIAMCLLAAAVEPVGADVDGAVRDAAARIDFGFFTGDESLILAAREALETRARDPWARYVAAYAAYRAAALRVERGSRPGPLVEECESAARAAADSGSAVLAAEGLVVAAACAALAAQSEPVRGVLHLRRARQALAEARQLDAGNPRAGLVLHQFPDTGDGTPPTALDVLVAVFARKGINDFPSWGEAEALTLLGGGRIESGDLRGARDALEEALMIAPDYLLALDLHERIARIAAAD